jgi:hypothetical protein
VKRLHIIMQSKNIHGNVKKKRMRAYLFKQWLSFFFVGMFQGGVYQKNRHF